MNPTQKRTIRNMLKRMTIDQIVKKTCLNRNQVSAAQFIYFTYSYGEVVLFRTKDEFNLIQDSLFKSCRLIEQLTEIPQLKINKYWAIKDGVHIRYRLGDYLHDIYADLTNNETV